MLLWANSTCLIFVSMKVCFPHQNNVALSLSLCLSCTGHGPTAMYPSVSRHSIDLYHFLSGLECLQNLHFNQFSPPSLSSSQSAASLVCTTRSCFFATTWMTRTSCKGWPQQKTFMKETSSRWCSLVRKLHVRLFRMYMGIFKNTFFGALINKKHPCAHWQLFKILSSVSNHRCGEEVAM